MKWYHLLFLAAWLLSACAPAAQTQTAATPSPLNAGVALLSASLEEPRQSWLFDFPVNGEGSLVTVDLPDQSLPYIARWSPDGEAMAVVLLNAANEVDLYLYTAASQRLEQVTDTPQCTEVGLGWTADSRTLRFAVLCRSLASSTEIYELSRADGSISQLGLIPLQALYVTWSPDLSLLALAYPQTLDSGERKVSIFVEAGAGLGSGVVTQPVTGISDAASGANGLLDTVMDWSPDGQYLAYVSTLTDGVTYLLRLPAQGGAVSVIRAVPGECLFPQWSPDGTQVSLVCGTDLYLVSADGSRQTLLVEPPTGWFVSFPAWSPDGQALAFQTAAVDNPAARRLDIVSLRSQSYTTLGEVLGSWQAGTFWRPSLQAAAAALQPTLTPAAAAPLVPANIPLPVLWAWGLVLLILAVAVTFRRLRRARPASPAVPGPESLLESEPREPVQEALPEDHEPQPGIYQDGLRPIPPLPPAEPLPAAAAPASASLPPPPPVPTTPPPPVTPSGDTQTLTNGINLIRSGAYEQGILTLRQYIAADDSNPVAWLWLGNAAAQQGDYRTAERCFIRADRLGSATARTALAWLETRKQKRP